MFIRKIKSRNGNHQIQVVQKVGRDNRVVKHLGTARNELELKQLTGLARNFIEKERIKSGKLSLFDNRYPQSEMAQIFSQFCILKVWDSATFDFFDHFYRFLGFDSLKNDCFRDLVIARIISPTSKAKTRDFLESKLNKRYSLSSLYRCMEKSYRLGYQNVLEDKVMAFAQSGSTISVLFFDVTTLYYESFDGDDFRKCGFSKDNKANQPQLIVTLTVTATGFPLQLRVFPGNKFEGHLMLPCIKTMIKDHRLKDFVVVADSAMVSKANMEELEENNLSYIVGARLGNLPRSLWEQVVSVPKIDGALKRFSFGNDRFLVVSYNRKRANKDRSDREKQIKRAAFVLRNPAVVGRRYKFLQKTNKEKWELNRTGIQKAERVEGLKGYLTNVAGLTDKEIVEKYGSLWQVEKSFRISKSDLKARPIFHTVREKIEAHLAIVFAGLAIVRLVEKTTNKSIQRALWLLDQIKEVVIEDTVNKEQISKYSEIQNQETKDLLEMAKLDWGT
ncbi:MAG: IS1634 family transposase [Patescibacteria group bacterium]